MKRSTLILFFLCISAFGKANPFNNLVNQCKYKEAFAYVNAQTKSAEKTYNEAILFMHFGAMGLSKQKAYLVLCDLSASTILKAQTYQLLFDISYYISDVEQQKVYADSAFYIYKKQYPNNSIYKAQYNINLTRYYNYFRRSDLSEPLAEEALAITRRYPKERFNIDLPMVYAQVYASFRNNGKRASLDSAILYCDSALYYHKLKYYGAENFNKIKLYQIKASIFLDCNTAASQEGRRSDGKRWLILAKQEYKKGNVIITKNIGNHHVLLSNGNALIGLVYQQQKDYATALNYYKIAENNLYPNNYTKQYFSAFSFAVLGIYDWSNACYYSLFFDTHLPKYLIEAIRIARNAEIVYETMLISGQKLNDYYSHIPYPKLAALYYQLYQITKRQNHLDSCFYFTEKEKFADIQTRKSGLNNALSNTVNQEKTFVDIGILRNNKYIGDLKLNKIKPTLLTEQRWFNGIKTVKQIQSNLPDSTCILLFSHYNIPVRFDPIVICHIISRNNYKLTAYELNNPHEFKDTIDILMTSIIGNDLKAFKTTSNIIYKKVFEPVKDFMPADAKKLLIAPISRYRNFPFEALIENSTGANFGELSYLLKKYAISYLISPSLTFGSVKKSGVGMYIFNPDFSKSDKAELPFNQSCSKWLKKSYESSISTGKSTKEQLYSCLHNGGLVHVATHAVGYDDYTNEGRIYTSDTPLFLNEVYSMNLVQQPFVVLTCCEADKGNLQYNVGNDNFSRAFSSAGASSVLSTLWGLDDKVSSELAKHFYENLSTGMDKSTALQQAKLFILTANKSLNASPFYWASSILTGDISAVKLEKNGGMSYLFWIGLFFTSVLVLLIIWKIR